MKRKIGENNRSVVFKRLEGVGDATNAKSDGMKSDTITISIEIDGKGLAGYGFFIDGKSVLWENMSRKQQVSVLNSFVQGYVFFEKFLREE